MQRQSRDHFDASTIPDDLAPIATVLSGMLPGDWRSMRPLIDRLNASNADCAGSIARCNA